MRRTLAVALGILALAGARAEAQLCRGLPTRAVFAVAHRDEDQSMTGEVGLGPFGMTGITANVALPHDPPNGSKSISYGARLYWGREWNNWGVCMLFGGQVGYAHLINAEGFRVYARITSRTMPVGMGFGRAIPVSRGIRLFVFALPQLLIHSRDIMVYDRSDTTTTPSSSIDRGVDLGGGLQFGPLLVRGSAFGSRDVPWRWRLTAGLSP